MTTISDVLLREETATGIERKAAGRHVKAGEPIAIEEKAKDVIPIFFTVDEAYAPLAAVAIESIAENASPDREYRVFVMHEGMKGLTRERIACLERRNFRIVFIPMADQIEGIADVMGNRLRADYFTLTIFYRLFIPVMFPEYDKGIYLDSDIVVPGDIARLYDEDLGGNLIGACPDLSVQGVPELVHYIEDAIGVRREKYINSGILLMDLKGLREAHLDERFLELLNTYHFDCIAPDQDYLNALCHGKIHYLDKRWDAMPVDGEDEYADPWLIHYNLFSKPWLYEGVAYADYFWDYAHRSGFLPEIERIKESYTDEQRQADSDSLARMVGRGEMIAGSEQSFRTVFNEGLEARL
ncbi:MAG: glycosyltransferase family 8 protein [Coriobacteriales bacterium]|jgi:lipopolysaccharide biosynthesis glycosyltransferase